MSAWLRSDLGRLGKILNRVVLDALIQRHTAQPNLGSGEDIRCVEGLGEVVCGGGYLVCSTAGLSPSFRLSFQMRSLNYQWLVHRVKVWLASAVTLEQPWWSKELQHASIIKASTLCTVYVVNTNSTNGSSSCVSHGSLTEILFQVKLFNIQAYCCFFNSIFAPLCQ